MSLTFDLLSKDDIRILADRIDRLDQKYDLILDLLREGQDRMLGVDEICERLGIGRTTFYRLATDNKLPFLLRIGGTWKAKENDVNDFLNTKPHEEKRN